MAPQDWQWKNKDGSTPGLLYESGNWGDILKLLWLTEVIDWKRRHGDAVTYLDPFAGDVDYPLGRRTRFRLACCDAPTPADDRWPSAARAAATLVGAANARVWDADPGRRAAWAASGLATVADGDDGWAVLERHTPDDDAVVLIDPYDVLAEWRARLPLILDRAGTATVLVYIYNRSGRSADRFRDYRAFRNALEDGWGDEPKRLGRVAADPFLPQCYHEMLFLPGRRDRARGGRLDELSATLALRAEQVNRGLWRAGVCDT